MRKTTCLICDVKLSATGMDKIDNLPIGMTETLHMPQLIMVSHILMLLSSSWKNPNIIKLLHENVEFSLHEKWSFNFTNNICVIWGI